MLLDKLQLIFYSKQRCNFQVIAMISIISNSDGTQRDEQPQPASKDEIILFCADNLNLEY